MDNIQYRGPKGQRLVVLLQYELIVSRQENEADDYYVNARGVKTVCDVECIIVTVIIMGNIIMSLNCISLSPVCCLVSCHHQRLESTRLHLVQQK